MGQCLGKEGTTRRGNYQKYEFTPKSSWRHKDSRMLSELEQLDRDGSGSSPTTMVNENASDLGSNEEINTAGRTAQSNGRLVFSDQDDHSNTALRQRGPAATGHTARGGYSNIPQEEVNETLYTAPSGDDADDDEDVSRPKRKVSNSNNSSSSSTHRGTIS